MSKKNTVLIVDDTSANIRILANILANEFDIVIATSGQDALKIVSTTNVDLILLDVMMPEMDGYEVCANLKRDDKTRAIPVVFITALNTSDAEIKGLEFGAIDFITKPFNDLVVLTRVRNHIKFYKQSLLLEELAKKDSLTGIANRREYDEQIQREFNRAQRENSLLSLVMIDIDYFKKYNDRYGHGNGDECLRKIAKTLQNSIKRPADLLARYGGEEFVIILPHTDGHGACTIASQLIQAVRDLKMEHMDSEINEYVSISAGVATLNQNKNTVSADELSKQADEALYKAKEKGRNQHFCHNRILNGP